MRTNPLRGGFTRWVSVLPGIDVVLIGHAASSDPESAIVCPDEAMLIVGCTHDGCEVAGCGAQRRLSAGDTVVAASGPDGAKAERMLFSAEDGFEGVVVQYARHGVVRQTREVLQSFDVDPVALARYCALRAHSIEEIQSPQIKHILFQMDQPEFRTAGEGFFRLKAIELLRELIEPCQPAAHAVQPDVRRTAHGDVAYRAQQLIAADLTVRHTIKDLAQECAVSPTLLKQAFRETFGVSIYQWYRAFRIHAAADLLASSPSTTVTEAALAVGYSNPSKFAQAFRAVMGESPHVWRKHR